MLNHPPALRSHPVPAQLPDVHARRQLRQWNVRVKIPQPGRLNFPTVQIVQHKTGRNTHQSRQLHPKLPRKRVRTYLHMRQRGQCLYTHRSNRHLAAIGVLGIGITRCEANRIGTGGGEAVHRVLFLALRAIPKIPVPGVRLVVG